MHDMSQKTSLRERWGKKKEAFVDIADILQSILNFV